MARYLPFYGRGIGFPFRINDATGGVVVTEGNADDVSVALQYLNEKWTIREEPDQEVNHIAESVAHILLTRRLEHDTLPEFGSDVFTILFEPNSQEFRLAAAHYFSFSTARWEKRARIPEIGGTQWFFDGQWADQGRLPLACRVNFIVQQVPGNLVAPFVTAREARAQEYPLGRIDRGGHDFASRYFGQTVYTRNGEDYVRLRTPSLMAERNDDFFYKVRPGDTWLLISWELYGDIRFWHHAALCYSYDLAKDGADRSYMDTTGDPPIGETIRLPSKARVMTMATR